MARDREIGSGGTPRSASTVAPAPQPAAGAGIENVHAFLEQCPTDDPAYAQIRQDFLLRRNGALVPAVVPCTPPMSVMPVSTELEVLQALRVMYYIDPGRTAPLPWTPLSLYDWAKGEIAGINIVTGGSSSCCETYDGKRYIRVTDTYAPGTAPPGETYDWIWVSGGIGLIAHETRHASGPGHVDCPDGTRAACDATYSDTNPGSYGVVYWLHKEWLNGHPNLGIACAGPWHVEQYGGWHQDSANANRQSIVAGAPPEVTLPASPGGPCPIAPALHLVGGANPSTVLAGSTTQLTVAVVRAFNPDSTGIRVAGNLAALGGAASEAFADIGWYNDRPFYNRVFRLEVTVPPAMEPATVEIPIQASDAQGRQASASITIRVIQPDGDSDGLPDPWETRFGLDPTSTSGDAGAGGDPDHDGKTNLQEYEAGTHPRGLFQQYFAEGATGELFETRLALLNAGDGTARVQVRFLTARGTVLARAMAVAPHSRATLEARDVAGLESAEFATTVESDVPVVADRTMRWDRVTGYGAHAETAIARPAVTWYLAEGATHSGFDLFYLLQNPNAQATQVRVHYLRPSGAPLVKTYALRALSRMNIWVNYEEFDGQGRALAATDVSAVIDSTDGLPIIVERAMYLSSTQRTFEAGHESAGVTAPATRWFLAEGATGTFFDLFVLIANPGPAAAAIEATYLLPSGATVVKAYTVPANGRFSIWVDHEDARLADTAVSTTIRSTNDVPVIVERAMWWPGSYGQWSEAHNSPGATTTATRWGLAEGEVGGVGAADTYVLIANTSGDAGPVKVTLLFEDGTTAENTYTVAGNSRFNVDVRTEFPASLDKRFGATVESFGATPAQIVVERAMYWNALGQTWAAGSNALGAPGGVHWDPSRLAQAAFVGGAAAVAHVAFTSDKDLESVTVRVGSALARLVSTYPATFASVAAHVPQELTLVFTVPPDSQVGRVEGAIDLVTTDGNGTSGLAVTVAIQAPGAAVQAAGPQGGVFAFPGGVVLTIPPGALTQPVELEITPLGCDAIESLLAATFSTRPRRCLGAFSAKPDGLVFAQPITVWLPVLPLNSGEAPVAGVADLAAQTFTSLPATLLYLGQHGVVEFDVRHFTNQVITAKQIAEAQRKSDAIKACQTCAGFSNPSCREFYADPLLPPCCQVPVNARQACPATQGCDCCMEKRVSVKYVGMDNSVGSCQLLSAETTVTYPDCPNTAPVGPLRDEESSNCPPNMVYMVEVEVPPPPQLFVCSSKALTAKMWGFSMPPGTVMPPAVVFPLWKVQGQAVSVDQRTGIVTASRWPGLATVWAIVREGNPPEVSPINGNTTLEVVRYPEMTIEPALPEVQVGQSIQLKAAVEYLCATCPVTWTSPGGMTVVDASGTLTGKWVGDSTVRATYEHCGQQFTAEVPVKVTPAPTPVKGRFEGCDWNAPYCYLHSIRDPVGLTVLVTWPDGRPVEKADVRVTVDPGGATVSPATGQTDAQGTFRTQVSFAGPRVPFIIAAVLARFGGSDWQKTLVRAISDDICYPDAVTNTPPFGTESSGDWLSPPREVSYIWEQCMDVGHMCVSASVFITDRCCDDGRDLTSGGFRRYSAGWWDTVLVIPDDLALIGQPVRLVWSLDNTAATEAQSTNLASASARLEERNRTTASEHVGADPANNPAEVCNSLYDFQIAFLNEDSAAPAQSYKCLFQGVEQYSNLTLM